MRHLFAVTLLAVICAACGQSGPLYLRDQPPPGLRSAKPEAYKPVPYPKDAGDEVEGAKKP